MDYTKIKAAEVSIIVDDEKLSAELFSIDESKWDTRIDNTTGYSWKSIFLTKNDTEEFKDFKSAKRIKHTQWYWNDLYDIPYIKKLIESLPLTTVGMVRAFIATGPLPIHVDNDKNTPTDLSYNLGLTIASRLTEPMTMEPNLKIKEKYILFNDTVPHGFPNNQDTQISIRIFGDFDYEKFNITKVYL
jgi:hypothetical protein